MHSLDNMEEEFDISLNFDEFHNRLEVANITYESLSEEENNCLSMFPLTYGYVLKFDDITEAVNMLTDIEEPQRKLRTAHSVELGVPRARYHEAREQFSGV